MSVSLALHFFLWSYYNYHLFQPFFLDSAFVGWHQNGFEPFKNLFIHNCFASFEQLSAKVNLFNHTFSDTK